MKHDKNWMQRWCEGYSYGHNVLRLTNRTGPSAECGRFARAYADITEDQEMEFSAFAEHWKAKEVEPDSLGTYHRAGPWNVPTGSQAA